MTPARIIGVLIFCGFFAVCVCYGQTFTSSDVSAEANAPVQHGSSIVELDDGSVLVSWYAGKAEAGRDTRILLRRSTNGAATWEPKQTIVVPGECAAESWFPNKALGNTVLFQDTEKVVWLFYAAVEFGGWSGAHVDYKTSRDQGRTWSESHRLTKSLGDIPRTKPLQLAGCEIFLPLSHSAFRKYALGLRFKTCAKVLERSYSRVEGSNFSHPAFVAMDYNRVIAFLRARGGGKLQSAYFDVTKNKWSKAQATNLPNPDSAIDAVAIGDGKILLAYNDNGTYRNPLSIAITDDGVSFRKLRDIANEPGQDFSYPCLIRARDGSFYLTYTWRYRSGIKCVHFDPAWLGLDPVSDAR